MSHPHRVREWESRRSPEALRALIKKLRRIEIVTRQRMDQGITGGYRSIFRGRGVEFSEARPYQVGDDVRAIDWNVSARMGEPFVKLHVEERDLSVFLAVDVSSSLAYGSRLLTKGELAAEISALLAFAAISAGDQVGGALLGAGMETFFPPGRRRNHALRLVWKILGARPSSAAVGTDLEAGLSAVLAALRRHTAKRRSVLFVLSDFLAPLPHRALREAARRHDTVVVELLDPHDETFPAVGPVWLRDAETGRVAAIHGRRAGVAFSEQRERERRELRQLTRQLGLDHLTLTTDRPYLPVLKSFFERRKARHKGTGLRSAARERQ